jgi:toxin YoeB
MNKLFTDEAWADYQYWISTDKKQLKRINSLIKDIDRNPREGIGKPEPLKANLNGYWSRRMDLFNNTVGYRTSPGKMLCILLFLSGCCL